MLARMELFSTWYTCNSLVSMCARVAWSSMRNRQWQAPRKREMCGPKIGTEKRAETRTPMRFHQQLVEPHGGLVSGVDRRAIFFGP